ncbi:hypothetical protein QG37_06501 [Candidozyma auris]|uniref:Uncharacterized protein n=1 Tax=Candidozyma auris TaxID=498019 RepID=A0A0L0NUD0_CANAR|nr:hypothetical protein QG37_06501 [[Candida] auris]
MHTMIQIGGLSTFSPFAARKIRSFFKGSNGIVVREDIRLCGAALTMWVQKQPVVVMVHGCHMPTVSIQRGNGGLI